MGRIIEVKLSRSIFGNIKVLVLEAYFDGKTYYGWRKATKDEAERILMDANLYPRGV